jgi:hypothetical protein
MIYLAGQYYYLKVEAHFVTGGYSEDIFEQNFAQTSCGCGSDSTGSPINLTLTQYLGKVCRTRCFSEGSTM